MKNKLKIKFVLIVGIDHQHYFRIVSARNGKILASSEGYRRKADARKGIRAIAHGLNPKLLWKDYKPAE